MGRLGSQVSVRDWVIAAVLTVAASATASAQSYTAEQERLCTPDAMRLCSHEIPSVERITLCMAQKKRQLSPGCRAVFNAGPQQAKARPRVSRPQVASTTPGAPKASSPKAARPKAARPATASAAPKAAAPRVARPAKKPAPKPDAGKS